MTYDEMEADAYLDWCEDNDVDPDADESVAAWQVVLEAEQRRMMEADADEMEIDAFEARMRDEQDYHDSLRFEVW